MNSTTFLVGTCVALFSASILAQAPTGVQIQLKYGAIDPATAPVIVPTLLRGDVDTKLWIVQFDGRPTDAMRQLVIRSGGTIHSYLPDNAYVVRMEQKRAAVVQMHREVRSVSYYHPAFRLEAFLRAEQNQDVRSPTRRYNMVVTDKHNDKPALAQKIVAIGGQVDDEMTGSILFSATLTDAQLLQVIRFDEVLWIDRWGAPEDDMNNARIQGGADYIESVGGYTGQGIIGHQYEGLNTNHVDWNLTPIGFPAGCTSSSGHGHNTAGIVYGNGTSISIARGMAPDAQAYFTSCRSNRWNNFQQLVNTHNIMFTTASWGSPRTRAYTSVSAEADDICFDHDLVWSNSQSNASTQDSRAEAWAKNVFSIGGVRHFDNSNPLDDSWNAGGASIGPAADGRNKPDFTAYYDNIATSASNGSYSLTFGGTSGATPIVAGHNALAIQMFTDGVFGNTLRKPGGTRFENKPKFPTLKALQMATAAQYAFTAASTDNRREHQGWGFPDLKSMWDNRTAMFIVDEVDVIKQGEGVEYVVDVAAGRTEVKFSMSFADQAGNPASAIAAINDLTLRVTSPSGTQYWGNAGLEAGNYSTTGGNRDRINTTENVFIKSPAAGQWKVTVVAYVVAMDSHVETPAMDADYGLVVNGGTFSSQRGITVQVGSISTFGTGCVGTAVLPNTCVSLNPNGGSLTNQTRQWEYAYEARTTTAISVAGFELLTRTSGVGSVNAPVAIYMSTGGRPSTSPVATSVMAVGASPAFYKATFSPPVSIPAGATFYLAMRHNNNTIISTVTGGTSGPGYYRNGTWIRSGIATAPSYRVLCTGGGQRAIPAFTVGGVPEIGSTLVLELSLAVANAPAMLFTGASNTVWGPFQLPLSLAPLGGAGCSLFVSTDAGSAFNTDSNGRVSTNLMIPKLSNLIGVDAYQQFVIIDPGANQLGAAVSNAAHIKIGG